MLVDTNSMSDKDHLWIVTANCDFEYNMIASALPTSLELSLNGTTAQSTVHNLRNTKEYAVRYYFDTAKDRTGQSYFVEAQTLSENTSVSSFTVPDNGTLAPSGDYYVTAVLTEKVTGDFNGDGNVDEDEYSWVTVDTQTSDKQISFTNTDEPASPASAELQFTGNETLTASLDKVDNADGYRVTLYYQSNGNWEQAGSSYGGKSSLFQQTRYIFAR